MEIELFGSEASIIYSLPVLLVTYSQDIQGFIHLNKLRLPKIAGLKFPNRQR
jgi:hypothetical protein